MVPATLSHPGALRFWGCVVTTGVGAGLGAVALTKLLEVVQRAAWEGNGVNLLDAASNASAVRHVAILALAGIFTGTSQILLRKLTSSNSIDISEAIAFHEGKLPTLRTLGSALLAIVVVAMGASLGREGSPKQAAAVIADRVSSRAGLSVDEHRLLVACAAGAGMAAAYGVPLGGALFALEVLRGALALRLVLPALVTSLVATAVSFIFLPDAPTYVIPSYHSSASILLFAFLAGPIGGVLSVGYVRAITWADRTKPQGIQRIVAPVIVLGALGVVSIRYPQLLGNGRDTAQLLFTTGIAPLLVLALLVLKPAATILCVRGGVPGGLFTPSLTSGALLGAALGMLWTKLDPSAPIGVFAILGAAALLASTTQGPLSTIVLMLELTGRDRSFILPLIVVVAMSTVVSRSIEPRSIYDARLSEDQLKARLKMRANVPF